MDKVFDNTSSSPGFFHRETLSLLQRLGSRTAELLLAAVAAALLQAPSALAADWTQKPPANSPPARSSQAMADDATHGQDVLFGGLGANKTALSDTWIWDGSNRTQRSPANSPPARRLHGMASEPTRGLVLLFGGTVLGNPPDLVGHPVSDTWIWDGSNWSQQSPAHSPPARNSPPMTYSATGQTVMFGGFSDHSLSDTWVWAQFLSVSPNTLNFGYSGSLITSQQLATVNAPRAELAELA